MSRGVHSGGWVGFGQVSFSSVIFRFGFFRCVLRRVTLGWGQLVTVLLKIGYLSYRISTGLISVEVRVECQLVSSCHRLIIDFDFTGYRSGSGIFQVEFGYELLITIDRVSIKLSC